jgi:hypothetical protein
MAFLEGFSEIALSQEGGGMVNSDKSYGFYSDKFWPLLLLAVLLGASAFFLWLKLFGRVSDSPWSSFIALSAFWAGYYVYQVLVLPSSTSFSPDGRLEFKSTFRQKAVNVNDIQSIKPHGLIPGIFVIRARGNTIKFRSEFDGFHDFVARLQVMNPNIEFRGC